MRHVLLFLLASFCLTAGEARAQGTPTPEAITAEVAQGAEALVLLSLANAGADALAYCLSFARPVAEGRLSETALSSACGEPGEVLLVAGEEANGGRPWDPYGFAALPNGHLLSAEANRGRTFEFTADLRVVRDFDHPEVEEVAPSIFTSGIALGRTGVLWWLNSEGDGFEVVRALLLEGALDGTPTGRQVEIPVAQTGTGTARSGSVIGLAYDAPTARFLWLDTVNDDLWAADTLGTALPGYPAPVAAYPGLNLGFGLTTLPDLSTFDAGTPGDASDDTPSFDPAGPRLEFAVGTPGEAGFDRHVVVDPRGETTTPEADGRTPKALVTPRPPENPNGPTGVLNGGLERSATDPNGAVYYAWGAFDDSGVAMLRPHPVPPGWLTVERWAGSLAPAGTPGDAAEIALWMRPGQRAVGTYHTALQVFDAATESVVEVPLTMTVTKATDAEDDAPEPSTAALAVYPNPTGGTATAVLTVSSATEARVAVYDVLGRTVAVLHDGAASARLRLRLDTSALPPGVYVVRAETGDTVLTRRLTVVR